MSYGFWTVVIFVTAMIAIYGIGKVCDLIDNRADRRIERLRLLAQLDQATANVQLPRPGRLPYQGAQDPAYQLAPIPWELASAAYQLGQQRASQDEITREVEAIMAEIEHNPERWQL